MKKILFRADAKPSIGIGDLTSLINLSFYFDRDWEVYFIIRSYKAGVELIKKYNLKNVFIIDENLSLSEEINYINSFIKDNSINVVFFEITERKLSDYVGIDNSVKKVAVNFDENILSDLDLLIDWDVEAYKFFNVSKYPKTKFLLGAEYVILPKEFYSAKVNNREYNFPPKTLLIAMGGADELNFTQKVVDSIIKNNLDIKLNIIVGSGYEYKKELEFSLKKSNINYQIKQNIINMLDEYLSVDIAIGAGGLTSSELVASKTPTILIATYEHQKARCQYFGEQKFAKYLGYREFNEQELIEAIKKPIKVKNSNIFNTKVIVDEIKKISNS